MITDAQIETLTAYSERAIAFNEEIELAEISVQGPEENPIISISIWHPNTVDLDMCEKVSNTINELLEDNDPFEDQYTLEICSLSLSRKLKTEDDFRRVVGEKLKIQYKDKSQKNAVGTLKSYDEQKITLTTEKGEAEIPYSDIKKGLIEF